MMSTSKIIINIVIVALLIGGGWLVYSSFFQNHTPAVTDGVQTVGALSNTSGSLDQSRASEFVILLNNLKSVDLKSDIFSNQAFSVQLQDFTTPLPDRPRGRSNPFAPIGAGNITASTFQFNANTR